MEAAEEICCAYCGGDLPPRQWRGGRERMFCCRDHLLKFYGLKYGRRKYVDFDPAGKLKHFYESLEETQARRRALWERLRQAQLSEENGGNGSNG